MSDDKDPRRILTAPPRPVPADTPPDRPDERERRGSRHPARRVYLHRGRAEADEFDDHKQERPFRFRTPRSLTARRKERQHPAGQSLSEPGPNTRHPSRGNERDRRTARHPDRGNERDWRDARHPDRGNERDWRDTRQPDPGNERDWRDTRQPDQGNERDWRDTRQPARGHDRDRRGTRHPAGAPGRRSANFNRRRRRQQG